MQPKILFRKSLGEQNEYDIAAKYFPIIEYRSQIKKGDFIIPRYSSLPYYNELEKDVINLKGSLINSYDQHRWIANFEWYSVLSKYTFQSWDSTTIYRAPTDIKYVVKGKTNSKKWQWKKMMFAENRAEAIRIGCDLYTDGLIGYQGIIYRKFEKLKIIEEGLNGLPFANEYRFFFYKNNLLASGFYWSIADEPVKNVPKEATKLAQEIANIVQNYTNFYVLDIAEKEDGSWILVEVNCGTMSGLSLINSETLYGQLKCSVCT